MCVLAQVSEPSGAGDASSEMRWTHCKSACFWTSGADEKTKGGSAGGSRMLVLVRVFAQSGAGDASSEMRWIHCNRACFWTFGADEKVKGGSASG